MLGGPERGPISPVSASTDASILLKFHLKWQRNEEHTLRQFRFIFCERSEFPKSPP
jgi:hypothetical protein